MPVGAALGVSGLAGAAANIWGANTQAKAAKDAAGVQREMYGQTREDLAPYRTAGAQATNMLMGRLPELTAPIKLDQAWLEQTPGYQFNLRQGLKGVQNSAAARGLGTSGAALKGAANYATGLADSTYQNQFTNELAQRLQSANMLMAPATLGANAAAQTGSAATQTGQGIGNALMGGATAQAAGMTGAANALGNAAGQYLGYGLGQQQIAAMQASNANQGRGMYTPATPPAFQMPGNLLTRGNF